MAIDFSTPSRDEAIVLAGLAGVVGIGLLLIGISGGKGGSGDQHHLRSDETLGPPIAPGLHAGGVLQVALGTPLTIVNPTVQYSGRGRNAYTYLQIKQGNVTVYGSGIAALALAAATNPTTMSLVPATECQCLGSNPCGATGPNLVAYPWPGTDSCGDNSVPVCGRPPQPGVADVYLEIYEDQNESGFANDGVGYAPSPTCASPPRTPLISTKYPNAVVFV